MYHELLRDASFWSFLISVDQDLARSRRQEGCSCGGRLHCAHYRRKPRGGPKGLPEEYHYRLSFCCNRDGCRKRKTPPSVRFLGRKVYLGAVVVLVAAMRQGATPRRVRELSELFGADRRTIARWRVFWDELVPRTKFWHVLRARLVPKSDVVSLPLSLLQALVRGDDDRDGWKRLLCFLSPITITGGLEIKVSAERCQPAEDDSRRS
ncbi:MAG: hypothetical protein WCH75_18080 [Candidatus Binatia bacterium]